MKNSEMKNEKALYKIKKNFYSSMFFDEFVKRDIFTNKGLLLEERKKVWAFNAGNTAKDVNLDLLLGDGTNAIFENLDEQAMRSIRTMIMVEYARCTSTPGEVIVKSFDGMNFNVPVASNAKAKEAHRAIKEIKQSHEE